jgi:hypothetical protein
MALARQILLPNIAALGDRGQPGSKGDFAMGFLKATGNLSYGLANSAVHTGNGGTPLFSIGDNELLGAASLDAVTMLAVPEGRLGAAKGAAGALKGLGNIGSHGVVDASTALSSATKWLGTGYKEMAPGVFRSADGLRQFRMTTADLLPTHGRIGSHVHFEALDDAGKVIENLHLPVGP